MEVVMDKRARENEGHGSAGGQATRRYPTLISLRSRAIMTLVGSKMTE